MIFKRLTCAVCFLQFLCINNGNTVIFDNHRHDGDTFMDPIIPTWDSEPLEPPMNTSPTKFPKTKPSPNKLIHFVPKLPKFNELPVIEMPIVSTETTTVSTPRKSAWIHQLKPPINNDEQTITTEENQAIISENKDTHNSPKSWLQDLFKPPEKPEVSIIPDPTRPNNPTMSTLEDFHDVTHSIQENHNSPNSNTITTPPERPSLTKFFKNLFKPNKDIMVTSASVPIDEKPPETTSETPQQRPSLTKLLEDLFKPHKDNILPELPVPPDEKPTESTQQIPSMAKILQSFLKPHKDNVVPIHEKPPETPQERPSLTKLLQDWFKPHKDNVGPATPVPTVEKPQQRPSLTKFISDLLNDPKNVLTTLGKPDKENSSLLNQLFNPNNVQGRPSVINSILHLLKPQNNNLTNTEGPDKGSPLSWLQKLLTPQEYNSQLKSDQRLEPLISFIIKLFLQPDKDDPTNSWTSKESPRMISSLIVRLMQTMSNHGDPNGVDSSILILEPLSASIISGIRGEEQLKYEVKERYKDEHPIKVPNIYVSRYNEYFSQEWTPATSGFLGPMGLCGRIGGMFMLMTGGFFGTNAVSGAGPDTNILGQILNSLTSGSFGGRGLIVDNPLTDLILGIANRMTRGWIPNHFAEDKVKVKPSKTQPGRTKPKKTNQKSGKYQKWNTN